MKQTLDISDRFLKIRLLGAPLEEGTWTAADLDCYPVLPTSMLLSCCKLDPYVCLVAKLTLVFLYLTLLNP